MHPTLTYSSAPRAAALPLLLYLHRRRRRYYLAHYKQQQKINQQNSSPKHNKQKLPPPPAVDRLDVLGPARLFGRRHARRHRHLDRRGGEHEVRLERPELQVQDLEGRGERGGAQERVRGAERLAGAGGALGVGLVVEWWV